LETRAVSATGEGRHTTVRRELICLAGDALVIDTPRIRELGILGAEDGIEISHSDIGALASRCRYRDCTHTAGPGCAVLRSVKSSEISRTHLESSLKLREESAFYELSHAEKRKNGRDFGKDIKSAKKGLRPDSGLSRHGTPESLTERPTGDCNASRPAAQVSPLRVSNGSSADLTWLEPDA
jgi:ribosome biogenesis GTPase